MDSAFADLQISDHAMSNTLHKHLPAEIRLKIFELVCCNPWNGKMPNIIQALRPDPVLYFEALEVFVEDHKCFVFHKANEFSFRDMSKKAVQCIRNVKIVVEYNIPSNFKLMY